MVFDLDDTLYLERDFVRSGFRAAGNFAQLEFGIEGLEDVAWALFEQGRRQTIFDQALAKLSARSDDSVIRTLVDVYRSHVPEIALLADAARALDKCKNEFRVALLTDGPAKTQMAKVRALGLDGVFSVAVYTGALGDHAAKPSDVGFRLIQDRLKAEAGECIYIGDNPKKDFIAPRRLGWRTVRVKRKLGIYTQFEPEATSESPDVNLTSLDDLVLEERPQVADVDLLGCDR